MRGTGLSRPENNPQVKTAWHDLLVGAHHVGNGALRDVIGESWRRCVLGRVDPARGEAPARVEHDDLETLRAANERLIAASAPFMMQSRDQLAQTGTVMVLTDPQGVVLDVEGDPQLRQAIGEFGMTPGNSWSESGIGTNAIGTALALAQPIQVHGAEHFCEPIQRWTCSASVIRDPVDGSVVGALDISGMSRDYSAHSLPLVVTTANSIENRLAQMELEERFQLLEAGVAALSAARGVALFDARGRLVKANERAAPLLAAEGVVLTAETRIPVAGRAAADAELDRFLPARLLADRVEPLFRGRRVLGYVVSLPEPAMRAPVVDEVDATVRVLSPSATVVVPEAAAARPVSGTGERDAVGDLQRRLAFLTTHDGLTGLANRKLLAQRLGDALVQERCAPEGVGVLLINLYNFKDINHTLGHDFGDLLLEQVADRLRRCLADAHTLARIGGDEFAAIVKGHSVEALRGLVARTLDYLGASFCIEEHDVFAAASIGIAIFPTDGDTAAALLKNADTALHEAKALGRNRFRFFSAGMQDLVRARMSIGTGLRAAIEGDRFRVVYQPQYRLEAGRLVGAEALVRWHDPELGDVPPSRFIPAAEEAGLIVSINDIVMAKVLAQIALWRMRGLEPPRISINVAAQQLREPGFVEQLCRRLDERAVPAGAICLELTEGTLLADIEGTARMFERLGRHGIAVSIDDFGTGYSSLSYLTRLPVHELKVDQSFVQGIASEAGKRSIIVAIVDMAHALGIEVLAEGIETESQLAFLRERRCEMGQGYLFHRPLGVDDFEKLMV
ncbi:diguanylate cyclase (GGDEF) domain-containing protein [Aromatoleum tolulyticum]|uniref:Diguanylate cyclase (GGDEF) domain-containing protein n=1 Tax=Aromatoleum tolulyticum TaxID=34027 RepID=A0A1N7ALP2_9RHOO|nr:diguanylate cyclase (GGDEF) domain-containing protein [Aromatoleum tolulyticum]